MSKLKDKLTRQIPSLREEAKSIAKDNAQTKIGDVVIDQLYGGMRGIKGLICDTSEVGLETGLIIRGIPILELTGKLPEEVFYLMVTGELPDADALKDLQKEISSRAEVPQYVWDTLDALPKNAHPMAMFSTAIIAMEGESKFRKAYDEGAGKDKYWEYMYEDCLDIIARSPVIAAYIYRKHFGKGEKIDSDPSLDYGSNFANMLGIEDKDGTFAKLMCLYLVLHCDHEGGNVSAFTCQTVGSALSDAYYAISAGLNGLAGPLHGLANQECLKFIVNMREEMGHSPSDDEVRQYCRNLLSNKRVIPGYGHAVLRVTDPRFTAFLQFGEKFIPEDEIFKIVKQIFEVVPPMLKEIEKIKDPWPNVDAASGSLLYHFGLKEYEYYTVLFGVSRILGFSAQLILARGTMNPIIRPKSVTTEWVKKTVSQS